MSVKHTIILTQFAMLFLLCAVSCASPPKNVEQATRRFNDNFSGTVLAVDGGTAAFRRTYGSRITADSKYRIGSVSKTFIAASIALLADRKQLRYDQTISDFFPSLKYADRITVLNLVDHTSGLADFSGKDWYEFLARKVPKDECVRIALSRPPAGNPDGKYRYSSINYILLGGIIEKVSGMDAMEFIEANILRPLGMKDTGYADTEAEVEGLTPGTCVNDAKKYENYPMNYSMLYYCGGMYSTLNDMKAWCEEFSYPKVLPKWYTDDPRGWNVEFKFGHRVQYHFGNAVAYSALVLVVKDKPDSYYIVLSDQGNTSMNPSIKSLPALVFGEKK